MSLSTGKTTAGTAGKIELETGQGVGGSGGNVEVSVGAGDFGDGGEIKLTPRPLSREASSEISWPETGKTGRKKERKKLKRKKETEKKVENERETCNRAADRRNGRGKRSICVKILILIFFFLGEEARRENAVHRLLGEGIEEIVTAGITGE